MAFQTVYLPQISLTDYFVIMFTSCGKWLSWNKSSERFLHSDTIFFVVFDVDMMQQLHLQIQLFVNMRETI